MLGVQKRYFEEGNAIYSRQLRYVTGGFVCPLSRLIIRHPPVGAHAKRITLGLAGLGYRGEVKLGADPPQFSVPSPSAQIVLRFKRVFIGGIPVISNCIGNADLVSVPQSAGDNQYRESRFSCRETRGRLWVYNPECRHTDMKLFKSVITHPSSSPIQLLLPLRRTRLNPSEWPT